MSLTLFSLLVSFVSSINFSMKFNFISFHLRKANSGFVDEVNIGKEVIFDVYDTSTSLSVSESRECNIEKKKLRKCDFFYVRFVFSFPRVLFFTLEMPVHSHRNQAFPRFRSPSLLDSLSVGVQVIMKICNVNIPRSELRFM